MPELGQSYYQEKKDLFQSAAFLLKMGLLVSPVSNSNKITKPNLINFLRV